MKNKPLFYGMILAGIALTIFGLKADDDKRVPVPMQQWQHLAFETLPQDAVSDPAVSEKIVSLGNDGWELVTVLNFSREGTTNRTVYYFKKPQ